MLCAYDALADIVNYVSIYAQVNTPPLSPVPASYQFLDVLNAGLQGYRSSRFRGNADPWLFEE